MPKRNGRARYNKIVREGVERQDNRKSGRATQAVRRRREQHAAEIRAALNHIGSLSDAQIIQRRNAHVAKLREKFWPVVAIEAVEKMSAREYRQLLVSNLFRRHSE